MVNSYNEIRSRHKDKCPEGKRSHVAESHKHRVGGKKAPTKECFLPGARPDGQNTGLGRGVGKVASLERLVVGRGREGVSEC